MACRITTQYRFRALRSKRACHLEFRDSAARRKIDYISFCLFVSALQTRITQASADSRQRDLSHHSLAADNCARMWELDRNHTNTRPGDNTRPFAILTLVRSTHPFHTKPPCSYFGGPTTPPKKREHSRERSWTAEAPSPNFAHFGVRDRAKMRL